MIRELIVTTISVSGVPHIAPFGLIAETEDDWVIAPFHPSVTLDNLREVPFLVANYTDEVRVFAGCVTGRRDWPYVPATKILPPRLAVALAHAEMAVVSVQEDAMRPRFHCRIIHRETHAPFTGLNRAKAAVIEGAILVSRLGMLPSEKIAREVAYLEIAIGKTAGPAEREAWGWLMERLRVHFGGSWPGERVG
jgi:hypothetical protein